MDSPQTAIRRRQVDVDKPIQVVWMKEGEVSFASELDLSSPIRARAGRSSLPRERLASIHELPSSTKDPLGEVAIPSVRDLSAKQGAPEVPYKRPPSYIHYYDPPYDFEASSYQLDDQDDDFLEIWNDRTSQEPSLKLEERSLEEYMTLFENLSYQQQPNVRDVGESQAAMTREAVFREDLRDLSGSIESTPFRKRSTRKALQRLIREFLNLQGLFCEADRKSVV